MKKVLVIIPAYNEQDNILNAINSLEKSNLDYIIINDGSTDNTEEVCKKNNLNYISLVQNLGIGGAVQTGYKYALENNYDIAVQFDGDGQHNSKYISELIKPVVNGQADFVIGSRFINNISEFRSTGARRIGIKIISFLIKLLTRKKITDPTSGFRAANKDIIKLFSNNYPSEYPEPESIVTLIRKKYKVMEIPVKMQERTGGVSSIRAWKTLYYITNVSLSIVINSLKRGDK
jgi:glycosyltransferase involved in cell wall biosynthesis